MGVGEVVALACSPSMREVRLRVVTMGGEGCPVMRKGAPPITRCSQVTAAPSLVSVWGGMVGRIIVAGGGSVGVTCSASASPNPSPPVAVHLLMY
ncbi:hypothetical protein Pmani_021729 [Petrolisthes manimaculis]|uniref:Uncharacterized protein n=1 Tax=Petrolisthes manimaculis TaxID=1843537 RepID=A0AAE1U1V7_9EUCA|nr:hypothetical protein Pmani_021729 [Petrolisthes manimaculis]